MFDFVAVRINGRYDYLDFERVGKTGRRPPKVANGHERNPAIQSSTAVWNAGRSSG